jgi:hypothetical protein
LQDRSEISRNGLYNERHETSNYFRNKKREYLKEKFYELTTHTKNKNTRDLYRGMHSFNRDKQPRSNLAIDGDLPDDSYNILNRWKNHFS